jgi:uncharacterized protein YegL
MAFQPIDKNMNTVISSVGESTVTDVICIIDQSGSMASMGDEPVQALNAFLEEQKSNTLNDKAVITLITFNNYTSTVVDHQPIGEVPMMEYKQYVPCGGTALNDAVCSTIDKELTNKNPLNNVVVIITDGQENGSRTYTTSDTREKIINAENNYGWKFIFLGANIDAFASGENINISHERCAQFNSSNPGELLSLARQTSMNVNDYRRSRSDGQFEHPLSIDIPKNAYTYTYPCHNQRNSVQSPAPNVPPSFEYPIPLKRSYSINKP